MITSCSIRRVVYTIGTPAPKATVAKIELKTKSINQNDCNKYQTTMKNRACVADALWKRLGAPCAEKRSHVLTDMGAVLFQN